MIHDALNSWIFLCYIKWGSPSVPDRPCIIPALSTPRWNIWRFAQISGNKSHALIRQHIRIHMDCRGIPVLPEFSAWEGPFNLRATHHTTCWPIMRTSHLNGSSNLFQIHMGNSICFMFRFPETLIFFFTFNKLKKNKY